jgi:tRNA nucleotidyltransferase/poly(A) polymerase
MSVQHIMALFDQAGFEIRIVGGAVRDHILKRTVSEVDLATTAPPGESMELLKSHNIQAIPTGIDHGTVTAVINDKNFEITTLRRDVETDGRHAKVIFGGTWEQDAERRDFTVNALSMDQTGKVFDYFDGLKDIQSKTLRFVGNAEKRVQEDYLRILRYFRFLSVLGWDAGDQASLAACIKYKDQLAELSRERIQNELYKTLLGRNAVAITKLMAENGLLPDIGIKAFPKLATIEDHYNVKDALRRVITLWATISEKNLSQFLVLTNKDKDRLKNLDQLRHYHKWPLAKQLYYFGQQAVLDYNILAMRTDDLSTVQSWQKPAFPIKAEDVMALTKEPGPLVGQIMKKSEEYWVDHQFGPDKSGLMDYIRQEFRF